MLALRHLIPRLMPVVTQARHSTLTNKAQPSPADASTITLDSVLQIFELLLHYLDHKDHNVVTASLETLQQLLKCPPPGLVQLLTTRGSLTESTIYGLVQRERSQSTLLRSNDVVRETLSVDHDVLEYSAPNIKLKEKF